MNGDGIAKGLLEKAKEYKRAYIGFYQSINVTEKEMLAYRDTQRELLAYVINYVEVEDDK